MRPFWKSSLWLSALVCGSLSLLLPGAAAPEQLDTRSDIHPQVTRDREGNLVFRNRHLVAVLRKGVEGWGPLVFYPATRPTQPQSAPAAVAPVTARFVWQEGSVSHEGTFVPSDARITGGDRVELRGSVRESPTAPGAGTGGASPSAAGPAPAWEAEAALWIGPEAWLSWQIKARPSPSATLAQIAPLPLQAGHAGPWEALLPGVFYAAGTDVPSRPRAGEGAAETLPDPYRITVPVLALSQGRTTVALLWDNRQPWGGAGYPSARFGPLDRPAMETEEYSPRFRMEVLAPAPARPPAAEASSPAGPAPAAGTGEIRLAGKIAVLPDERSPAQAVRQWVKAFGPPITAGFPRDYQAERKLTRQAYTGALWRPSVPGWRSSVTGSEAEARPSPFPILALLMDAGLSRESAVKEQLRSQADQALAALRKAGPLDPRLAYRTGDVLAALQAERARVTESAQEQLANGSWPSALPSPLPPSLANLGRPYLEDLAQTEVGLVAGRALPILRYAAITGDSDAAGAGIRALDRMDRQYRLPEAGPEDRSWTSETVLAAAQAAECFLLGYQITGEDRYVESARYWADTGLPFVYFWGDREHPALKHAVVPALSPDLFNTAGPVEAAQESGLVYARVLRALSRVRPDGLYDYVSEGIVASAMQQQPLTGEGAGLYPERWRVSENRGESAQLSPDLLLAAMYPLMGYDTEVSHARVRVGPDRIFVASGATIHQADTSAMRVRLKLRWLPGEETYTTITGVVARPLSVEYNSSALISRGIPLRRSFLPEGESEAGVGWSYDPDTGIMILRLRHTGVDDHLEIRWPDPRERTPIDRVDTKVRPRR
jgi:hypothetical protein